MSFIQRKNSVHYISFWVEGEEREKEREREKEEMNCFVVSETLTLTHTHNDKRTHHFSKLLPSLADDVDLSTKFLKISFAHYGNHKKANLGQPQFYRCTGRCVWDWKKKKKRDGREEDLEEWM